MKILLWKVEGIYTLVTGTVPGTVLESESSYRCTLVEKFLFRRHFVNFYTRPAVSHLISKVWPYRQLFVEISVPVLNKKFTFFFKPFK